MEGGGTELEPWNPRQKLQRTLAQLEAEGIGKWSAEAAVSGAGRCSRRWQKKEKRKEVLPLSGCSFYRQQWGSAAGLRAGPTLYLGVVQKLYLGSLPGGAWISFNRPALIVHRGSGPIHKSNSFLFIQLLVFCKIQKPIFYCSKIYHTLQGSSLNYQEKPSFFENVEIHNRTWIKNLGSKLSLNLGWIYWGFKLVWKNW
jgi:hypothetical protein